MVLEKYGIYRDLKRIGPGAHIIGLGPIFVALLKRNHNPRDKKEVMAPG